MKRALVLMSVAWICGACSSDDGGGNNDGVGNGGSTAPDGSGAGANPGEGSTPVNPAAPPLTVASISPKDDASEVALDAVIKITFSAALNPATVTSSSVVVQGPEGPLEGELKVEGEVVQFTPASKLPLLTPVRISLGTALLSSEGGALAGAVEAEFRSRDGVFREPVQVNAGAAASLFLRGNDAGDLIATWTDLQVTSSVEAIVFDADLGTWTEAQLIESDTSLAFSRPVAAVGPSGDSIVTWRGGGWTRYAGGWSTATVGATISLPNVALGANAALSVSNGMGNASYQLLPNGVNEWSAAQTLLMGGQVSAIDALAGGFIAIGTRGTELVAGQLSDPAGAWSEFASIGTIRQVQRMQIATHGDTSAVAWVDVGDPPAMGDSLDPVTKPSARVFAAGAWSEPIAMPDGTQLPWISVAAGGRALAIWKQGNAINASSYSTEQGWAEPEQLAEESQLTPAGGVDGAGNLMALWPSSQEIFVHRQVAGGEWKALEPVESQVTVSLWSHVDQQGRVNLVWQNGSGIWWTRFE
jgi:hypothetical protein